MQDYNDDQAISNLEETQDSNLETESNENEPELDETNNPNETLQNDELEKAKQLAQNYKIRAEKAEQLAKQLKNSKPIAKAESDLNWKDVRALQDVPDDDIDEVIEFARFKKISIAEAKKSPIIQVLLKNKSEERATAEATSVNSSRRSTSKMSPDVLISKLTSGQLKDDEMESAVRARLERARKNN